MGEIKIGEFSYFGGDIIRRGSMNTITIGKYCSIANGVIFDSGFNHNMNFVSTYPFNSNIPSCSHLTGHPICKGDIIIGNDVWIGEDAIIMSGVTIGDGAVIAARSIVTKDVEPYSMVAGSSARIKKYRFTKPQIEYLLKIKWWDWDNKTVAENAHLLMGDIDIFLSHF